MSGIYIIVLYLDIWVSESLLILVAKKTNTIFAAGWAGRDINAGPGVKTPPTSLGSMQIEKIQKSCSSGVQLSSNFVFELLSQIKGFWEDVRPADMRL